MMERRVIEGGAILWAWIGENPAAVWKGQETRGCIEGLNCFL